MKSPLATIISASLVVAMFFAPSDRAAAFDPSCAPELGLAHASGRPRWR